MLAVELVKNRGRSRSGCSGPLPPIPIAALGDQDFFQRPAFVVPRWRRRHAVYKIRERDAGNPQARLSLGSANPDV